MQTFASFLYLSTAFADVPPQRIRCPKGHYGHYQKGPQCIRNGYVFIELPRAYSSWNDLHKIEAGELVIPGLELSKITFKEFFMEVKAQDQKDIQRTLKNFYINRKNAQSAAPPSITLIETTDQHTPLKKNITVAQSTDTIEKENVQITKDQTSSCSHLQSPTLAESVFAIFAPLLMWFFSRVRCRP